MKAKFKLIGRYGDYRFWKSLGKGRTYFQATKTDKPPTIEAGYYSLDYLLDIKTKGRT